jgi:hypothetical protein
MIHHQLFSIKLFTILLSAVPKCYPTLLFLDEDVLAYRKQQQQQQYYPLFF